MNFSENFKNKLKIQKEEICKNISSEPLFEDNQPKNHQCYVHCSAGIGRTGVFIASNLMMPDTDIVELIRDMRERRLGMVQTEEQFAFLQDFHRKKFT